MNIAVTGASGHIGNNLVRALIKRGHHVKALFRNTKQRLFSDNIELIEGDLFNKSSLLALCHNVDLVYHLAAKISISNMEADVVYKTNVEGTKNLLDAALQQKVKKFIHFSSINAFNHELSNSLLSEDSALKVNNDDFYGYSKAESERLVATAVNKGLDAVILCPTGVFGPNDYRGSYLGKAIRQIYLNKYPMLVDGGFNWVDVGDVVEAAMSFIENGISRRKYILCGQYHTLKEVSNILGQMANRKTHTLIVPMPLLKLVCPLIYLYGTMTRTEPLFTKQSLAILSSTPQCISGDRAKKDFGFTPRSFMVSLRDTIHWYKANNWLK